MPSAEAPANVRVLVRVRPLSDSETHGRGGTTSSCSSSGILSLDNGGRSASSPMDFGGGATGGGGGNATVSINDGVGSCGYGSGYESDSHRSGGAANGGAGKNFQFDAVLGPRSTQADVFGSVKGIVEAVAAGYNGTVVAYGQTSSGKTHTVFGNGGGCDSDSAGLVQRSLKALFRSIALSQAESATGVSADDGSNFLETSFEGDTTDMIRETTAKASFFEIFNEKVYDLLSGSLETALPVREDAARGVYVDGLQEVEVNDTEEAEIILAKGAANRQVASTSMNRTSSRSHAVFVLTLRSVFTNGDGLSKVRTSKFTLVDLAGSERQRSTNATGDRLKEASSINSSLLTLGNVINALVDRENGRDRHVPFRDSKLTFLLRDSWGGNSKTCLVATVSPAAASASETVSTLKFAQRAKQIKNTAILNEDTCGTVAALRAEVARLRSELESNGSGSGTPASPTVSSSLSSSSFGRPPLPSSSASSGNDNNSSGNDGMIVVVERRARRAEGKVSTLQNRLDQKEKVVASLKRKLQEEHMVQKFKQRRIDYLTKKVTSSGGTDGDSSTDASANQEVATLLAEIDSLRKQIDRPSPDLVEMKVEYERVKEELELKNSETGPSKFEDIERESLENLVNKLTDEKRGLETKLSDISKNSSDTQKEIDVILEEVGRLETEMKTQKETLKSKEEEIWLVTESGAAAQAKNDELQNELCRTKEDLTQAKSDFDNLNRSTNDLKLTIERLSTEIEEKKALVVEIQAAHVKTQEESQTKLDALRSMLEESNVASDDKAAAEIEVREQLAAASKDNSILVQRITEASTELNKQKDLLKDSETRLEQMQQEKDKAVQDADQRLKDATASYEARIDMLETEKSSLSEQIQAKSASEKAAAAEIAGLKASLDEVEAKLDEVQQDKAAAVSDLQTRMKEQEATLNAKVQSFEEQKSELESKINSLNEASAASASEAEAAIEIERATNQSAVAKLEETIASLQSNKEAAVLEVQKQKEEVHGALEARIKVLEDEKSALIGKVNELEASHQEHLNQDEDAQTAMKTTIEELEGKIQTLVAEKDDALANVQKELEDAKTAFANNIQTLEDEKAELVSQMDSLNTALEDAKSKADNQADEDRKSHEAAVTVLEEEKNAALKAVHDELASTKAELESKVQALEEEKGQLHDQLTSLQTAVTGAEATSEELDVLRAKIAELMTKLDTSEMALKAAEDQIQTLSENKTSEVDEMIEKMSSVEDECAKAQTNLKLLEAEKQSLSEQAVLWEKAAEDAKKQAKNLKDQIKVVNRAKGSLEFQLESLSEDQDTLNDTVRGLQDRNDELEDENERLRKLLKESGVGMNSTSSEGGAVSTPCRTPPEHHVAAQDDTLDPTNENSDAAMDLASRMDAVITRMSEVKAPAVALAQDDYDDDDSFDEDMFLPNASSATATAAKNEGGADAGTHNTPSKPTADKENAGTPFRPKSTGKKRPLSALKTPSTQNANKKLHMSTTKKSVTTPLNSGVKWPKVMSETKHRTGWSSSLKM